MCVHAHALQKGFFLIGYVTVCVPIWRNSIVKEHIIIIIHIVQWE